MNCVAYDAQPSFYLIFSYPQFLDRMDNIGKAVLSHDFGNLGGHTCSILAALDTFHAVNPSGLYIRFILFTAEILYALFKVSLPNIKEQQFKELAAQFKALAADFLIKARKEPEDSVVNQSVLGVLRVSSLSWLYVTCC